MNTICPLKIKSCNPQTAAGKFFTILLFSCVASAGFAQDTTAPQVLGASVVYPQVNSGQWQTVNMVLTDDISGIDPLHTGFSAHINNMSISSTQSRLVSGNTYQADVYIHPSYPSGVYNIEYIRVMDLAGNTQDVYDTSGVFHATFVVVGANPPPDSILPVFNSFTLVTDTVAANGYFRCRVSAVDNESGLSIVQANLVSPGNAQGAPVGMTFNAGLGEYEGYNLLDQWRVPGQWEVKDIVLVDYAHNTRTLYHGIDYTGGYFQVVGTTADTVPPEFLSVSVTPDTVHRGDSLTVVLQAKDTLSGLQLLGSYYNEAHFDAPNNITQDYSISIWTALGNDFYRAKVRISEYAADGQWNLQFISLLDSAYNSSMFNNGVDYNASYVVMPDSLRHIDGMIQTSGGAPLQNSRVFLIKQDAVDSNIYVMRLAHTDATGYYQFRSEKRDSVIYIKAIPNDTVYPGQIPTYLDSSATFTGARRISITDTFTLLPTFHTLAGTNPGGMGFISGFVNNGAGKREGGLPVEGLDLILATTQGDPIQYATTDAGGYFEFSNIPDGEYTVYPVSSNVDLDLSPVFLINGATSYADVEYVYEETHLEAQPTSIEETTRAQFSLYPNPATNIVTISIDATMLGSTLTVRDIAGKKITETLLTTPDQQFDIENFAHGVYLVTVTLKEGGSVTRKLVK